MKKVNSFETGRIIMRHWRPEDAAALYKYASDKEVCKLAGWPRHESEEMSLKVIREVFMPNPWAFAITLRLTGEAIGCIGLVPEGDENVDTEPGEREVGYWIGRPYWNQGLVTEALVRFLDWCAKEVNAKGFIITTDVENAASQRVAIKCGFKSVSSEKQPPQLCVFRLETEK